MQRRSGACPPRPAPRPRQEAHMMRWLLSHSQVTGEEPHAQGGETNTAKVRGGVWQAPGSDASWAVRTW